ncbi:MAG: DUF4124 domain-containing protein [Burkholderiaceae bacterium]
MPHTIASRSFARIGLLAALLLCIALPAQAQWKWRDAAGKVQYSDLPPPNGTPEKDILQKPPGQRVQVVTLPAPGASVPAPASAPRAASAPGKSDAEQAKLKQQEQEQRARQKEEEKRVADQKRENCSRAQDNMKLLQDGVRVTRRNDKGENIYLDDAMRAEEIRRTRAVVDSECR